MTGLALGKVVCKCTATYIRVSMTTDTSVLTIHPLDLCLWHSCIYNGLTMENVEPSSSKRKRSEYSVWKKGGA